MEELSEKPYSTLSMPARYAKKIKRLDVLVNMKYKWTKKIRKDKYIGCELMCSCWERSSLSCEHWAYLYCSRDLHVCSSPAEHWLCSTQGLGVTKIWKQHNPTESALLLPSSGGLVQSSVLGNKSARKWRC